MVSSITSFALLFGFFVIACSSLPLDHTAVTTTSNAAPAKAKRAIKITGHAPHHPSADSAYYGPLRTNNEHPTRTWRRAEIERNIQQLTLLNQTDGFPGAETRRRRSMRDKRKVRERRQPGGAPRSVQEPLTDFIVNGEDLLYYGNLKIGTPEQELSVVFDTGSWDLWLATTCGPNCAAGYFDTKKSSTFRDTGRPFEIHYGNGSASGTIASDNVFIGNMGVHKQFFGAVTSIGKSFYGVPAAGIMGLSFSTLAQTHKPTFFENLMRLHELKENLFGLYLGRGKAAGSELTLGGIDAAHFTGEITELTCFADYYWTLLGSGTFVNGKSLGRGHITLIDSGTTQIYLPTATAAKLYASIPGARLDKADSSNGIEYYMYPCTSQPKVAFTFQGSTREFDIDPKDFNLGPVDGHSGMCFGGVVGYDAYVKGLPVALFGSEFLKSWYSVYRYVGSKGLPTVSFAKARA